MHDMHGAWLFALHPVDTDSRLSWEGARGDIWDRLDYLGTALRGGPTPQFPCSICSAHSQSKLPKPQALSSAGS